MAYRPPDDDPFEMKGKRPPEETEGGMQDTSLDDAEREFGMGRRQAGLDPNQGAQAIGETLLVHLYHSNRLMFPNHREEFLLKMNGQ